VRAQTRHHPLLNASMPRERLRFSLSKWIGALYPIMSGLKHISLPSSDMSQGCILPSFGIKNAEFWESKRETVIHLEGQTRIALRDQSA
jgi:hypothetical protein